MRSQLFLLLVGLCANAFLHAQVEIDKPINLTGQGSDGKITGIKSVTDNEDATNKQYVDSLVTNSGGGCQELEMPKAGNATSVINGSPVNLSANTPLISTGTWTVHSGVGGAFANDSSPTTTFSGNDNSTYVLKWTFTQPGCPTISDYMTITFVVAHYPDGNSAYWIEKDNGFRPVRIAESQTVYTYDTENKQYRNGNAILLPTIKRLDSSQPETANATSFFGFSGGSANNNNFQWDGQTLLSNNIYDVGKVFVSPVSATAMNYCRTLNANHSGTCNSSSSSFRFNTGGFAYPTTPNTAGPHTAWTGGDLMPTNNTPGFGNRRYSQQSLIAGDFNSYCVQTYGNGWRLPTDIEVGRPNNQIDAGVQTLNTGYLGTTNIQMWTSTLGCNSSGSCWTELRHAWRLNNASHTWPWSSGQLQIDFNNSVRCIYAGGN